MEEQILTYQQLQQNQLSATQSPIEICASVVMLDLPSGFILVEEMSEEDYPHPGALDRFRAAFRSACHRSFARINGLEPVVIDRSML